MSILIKGMKMPKDSYYIDIRLFSDGWAHISTDEPPYYNRAFEAIELPPHGRLIDAGALRQAMYHEAFETDTPMQRWDSGCWIRFKLFERMEEAAPTIIPADGGVDG